VALGGFTYGVLVFAFDLAGLRRSLLGHPRARAALRALGAAG
jgi:hypothetical protein